MQLGTQQLYATNNQLHSLGECGAHLGEAAVDLGLGHTVHKDHKAEVSFKMQFKQLDQARDSPTGQHDTSREVPQRGVDSSDPQGSKTHREHQEASRGYCDIRHRRGGP